MLAPEDAETKKKDYRPVEILGWQEKKCSKQGDLVHSQPADSGTFPDSITKGEKVKKVKGSVPLDQKNDWGDPAWEKAQ